MIEVETDGGSSAGTRTRFRLVLELVNEVLMGVLGELATLSGIKVNIVGIHVEIGGTEIAGTNSTVKVRACESELDIEFNLVVLKSNERNGKTRVAAEPEAHRNIHLSGGTVERNIAITYTLMSICHTLVTSRCNITGHINTRFSTSKSKSTLGTSGVNLSEITPDGEPESVLAINELASNLELELLEESVTEIAGNLLNIIGKK